MSRHRIDCASEIRNPVYARNSTAATVALLWLFFWVTPANDLAANLGGCVVSATPMTDETRNLGLAELCNALHGVVLCRNAGMHLGMHAHEKSP